MTELENLTKYYGEKRAIKIYRKNHKNITEGKYIDAAGNKPNFSKSDISVKQVLFEMGLDEQIKKQRKKR